MLINFGSGYLRSRWNLVPIWAASYFFWAYELVSEGYSRGNPDEQASAKVLKCLALVS